MTTRRLALALTVWAVGALAPTQPAQASGNCAAEVAGSTALTLVAPVHVSNAPADTIGVDVSCEITFTVVATNQPLRCWAYQRPADGPGDLVNGAYDNTVHVEAHYNSAAFTPKNYVCSLRRRLSTMITSIDPPMTTPGDVITQSGTIGLQRAIRSHLPF